MMLIRRLMVLGVGMVGLGAVVMYPAVAVRGAIPYIYGFHAGVLVAAVTVATGVFAMLLHLGPGFRRLRPSAMALVYVGICGLVWLPAIPLGDYLGRVVKDALYEKPTGDVTGWFYMDDSGMGGQAMRSRAVVEVLWKQPWWVVLMVVYCWLQMRHIRAMYVGKGSVIAGAIDVEHPEKDGD